MLNTIHYVQSIGHEDHQTNQCVQGNKLSIQYLQCSERFVPVPSVHNMFKEALSYKMFALRPQQEMLKTRYKEKWGKEKTRYLHSITLQFKRAGVELAMVRRICGRRHE